MKILLVTNYQPPHMGGIEFAAGSLKRCWEAAGHHVTWMTTDIPKGGQPSAHDNIRLPALNLFERYFQINSPIVSPFALNRARAAMDEHDVVNVHSFAPGLTNTVLRMALQQNKPMVVTQHVGIIALKFRLLDALQKHVYRRMARRCLDANVPLTFVGQAVRDWFADQTHTPPERFTMTPAGIDHDTFYFVDEAERKALRTRWELKDGALNVLFVGRFYEKKGLPLIRELATACPEVRFTLLGGGPIDPESWNLPNVRVLRFVPSEDLRGLYGAHDLFIMPSYGEGWPAVVPQAMACGLACMISDETFSGFDRNRERFIVLPRKTAVMADALRDAAAGGVELLKDRRKLSTYATETWDWRTTAAIYVRLFEEQIARASE